MAAKTSQLSCRFYNDKFPEVDDVVMVNVQDIETVGAYVRLLEYNDIEGMILLSELSRRRIRSINKLLRVGRNECVVVIRVDKSKGYIDLSKRRVSPEDIRKCEERYTKSRAVNSILRHVAGKLSYDNEKLEELYTKTAWALEKKHKKSAYAVFKQIVTEPSLLDECDLEEEEKTLLIADINQRLTPQAVKIRADVEVACYGYEGIDAVKEALRAGLTVSTGAMPIKINLIAPPLYVITTTTLERTEGMAALHKAIGTIREKIVDEYEGHFNIMMEPKVMTDSDEAELAKRMEQLELANQEVAGDDDVEDDDD